jgi:hypothetical protein
MILIDRSAVLIKVMTMKLVVSGSRSIKDKQVVFDHLNIFNKDTPIDQIVCGGAKGVDMAAVLWATRECIPFTVYLPNYKMYGKIAPLVRNEKMASYGNALLAIWDGKSRGTTHTVNCFRRLDKEVMLITVDGKSRQCGDNCKGECSGEVDGVPKCVFARQRKDKEPQERDEKDLADKGVEECS